MATMKFNISSKNQVISYSMFEDNSNGVWNTTHCVPDVFWGHWKYMGSDICYLKGLDAQKPEGYVKNSEKWGMKHQHTWKNEQMVAHQRYQFSIFLFFFQNDCMNRKNFFFSFLWYKSSFHNLYFGSWKNEEKRRDQFNDSPTMPEPRQQRHFIKHHFFWSLFETPGVAWSYLF